MPTPLPQVPKGTSGAYGTFRSLIPNAKSAGMSSPLGGQSGQYTTAVQTVFRQQGAAQKAAIIKGALANPNLPSSKIVLSIAGYNKAQAAEHGSGGVWGSLTRAVGQAVHHDAQPQTIGGGGSGVLGVASVAASPVNVGGAAKVVKNAGNDLWNLPAGTVEGLYGLGKNLAEGHFGNAFHMVVDRYAQFFQNPGKVFSEHPLNTLMLAAGPEDAIARLGGGAARAGLLGDAARSAASTARETQSIGTIAGEPSPIKDVARSYSGNPLMKAIQVAHERAVRGRGLDPNVVRSSVMPKILRNTFHVGIEAKLNRIADEMTAIRQVVGRAVRGKVTGELRAATKDVPKESLPIVSHVLQGVIRKPDTAEGDITAEINRLRAAQTGKRTVFEYWNRQQVRDLSTALKTPGAVDGAFKVAEKVRPVLHAQDTALVAKGLLDHEQTLRSRLFPYAMVHMGAKYDIKGAALAAAKRLSDAKTRESRAAAAIGDRKTELADAQRRHDVAFAQAVERRGIGRGSQRDLTGKPLPKSVAAQLDRHQVKLAAAQDRLVASQRELDAATAARREAEQHAGHTPAGPGLVKPNGDELTTDEILAHLKSNGVPDPAYVGHFPGKVAARMFYQAYKLSRGDLRGNARTGAAFRNGAYDHSLEGVIGQAAQRAEALTKAGLHDRIVDRLGIKKPASLIEQQRQEVLARLKAGEITGAHAKAEIQSLRTGWFTPAEARAFQRASMVDDNGNPIPSALELVPMTAVPKSQLDSVSNLQHPSELHDIGGVELKQVADAVNDAQRRTDNTRNVTLVPKVAAERFAAQFEKANTTGKLLGRVTQQFRRTVLPYSTHWMLQIATEANLRALVAGALDPRYLADGRALFKRLQTTEEGQAALAEMVNATLYNKHDPLAVHNPNPGVVSRTLHAFPPTKLLAAAHNRYANLIGQAMHDLEQQYRIMGLGKLAHQNVQEFSFAWRNAVKLQGQALDDLATRLKSDPALVARFGREIDNVFGRYNKFSPGERAAIQTIAPFLPWYLNAARFVLWQLPAKSPVASSLMASLRQTINQDIADGKQLPLNAWAMQEISRLSPFNIFTPVSSTPNWSDVGASTMDFAGIVAPEISGAENNLRGLNVFGTGPLKSPSGDVKAQSGQALSSAAESLFESFMPLLRYAREAEAGGRTTYGTSTIFSPQPEPGKKGGTGTALNRIFNPFYSFEEEQANKSAPAYAGKTAGAAPPPPPPPPAAPPPPPPPAP